MSKKPITARELMEKLNADPAFVARRTQAEEERQKREAEYRRAEAPLVAELRAAGVMVASAWDLVNTAVPYPDALPILLEHLEKPYPAAVREGIARALAVREAHFGWAVLMRLYRNETDVRVKDGMAVAIAGATSADTIKEVVALVRDTRQGPSRVLLLRALERSSDEGVRAALVELSTDPDLKKEIRAILRRHKQANH